MIGLFKGKKAFITIPLALGLIVAFLPAFICGGATWLIYKNMPHSKVRTVLIAVLAIVGIVGTIGLIVGASIDNSTTQNQTANPTSSTLSYKVVQTLNDYDTDKQLLDTTIYVVEKPTFSYDEGKIQTLINTIKSKECKVDDCDIQLYDDEQFAQESYTFDVASQTSQAALDAFDNQHPEYNNFDEHHFVAEYVADKLQFYPLIAIKNVTVTPYQNQSADQTALSTQQAGSISLYPNLSLTPGEAFTNVTAAQICTSGYTKTVRNVPTTEKEEVFAEYGIPYSTHANYEVDHFIPLELGGDNSIKNLWPEEGAIPNPKDKVENFLHAQVCAGKISLTEAQNEIRTDWYKVYLSITGGAPLSNSSNPTGYTSNTTTTSSQTGATGNCNDGTETYAITHQGACSHHGGVAQWY